MEHVSICKADVGDGVFDDVDKQITATFVPCTDSRTWVLLGRSGS